VVQGLTRLRRRALEPRLRQIELDLANHHADIESDPISLVKELAELRRQLHQPITLHAAV
jgi:DNA primase